MEKLLALLLLRQPIQGTIGKSGGFEEYVTCTPPLEGLKRINFLQDMKMFVKSEEAAARLRD